MPEYNWSQFAAIAKEHSGGPTLPEAEGYTSEIVDAGAKGGSGNKKTRLWWKHKIIVGPHAGATEIQSQQLDPSNPNAMVMFYRILGNLGIRMEDLPDGTPPDAVAKTAIGRRYNFDFAHRVDDKDQSPNPRKFAQFNNLVLIQGSGTQATPPPAAPPAAAPAATAPLTVEADAPATTSNVPTPEQIAAFLASQQAQVPEAPSAPATQSTVPF